MCENIPRINGESRGEKTNDDFSQLNSVKRQKN